MSKQATARPRNAQRNTELTLRGLAVGLGALLLGVNYELWIPPDSGWRQVQQLQRHVDQQRLHNQTLAQRNASLRADIDSLQNGLDAVEERARQDLNMIRRGETLYLLLAPAPRDNNTP